MDYSRDVGPVNINLCLCSPYFLFIYYETIVSVLFLRQMFRQSTALDRY